jgi:hypothetical protein
LSAVGSDPAGTASLHYTWSTISAPSTGPAPTFSANGTNSAQQTTVTFHAAGTYTFRVTMTDAKGLSVTSDVTVTVKQALTSIQVAPSKAAVRPGQADPMTARAFDQFGAALVVLPIFTWSIARGPGSVSRTGIYTVTTHTSGTALIQVSSGQISGTASVAVLR